MFNCLFIIIATWTAAAALVLFVKTLVYFSICCFTCAVAFQGFSFVVRVSFGLCFCIQHFCCTNLFAYLALEKLNLVLSGKKGKKGFRSSDAFLVSSSFLQQSKEFLCSKTTFLFSASLSICAHSALCSILASVVLCISSIWNYTDISRSVCVCIIHWTAIRSHRSGSPSAEWKAPASASAQFWQRSNNVGRNCLLRFSSAFLCTHFALVATETATATESAFRKKLKR